MLYKHKGFFGAIQRAENVSGASDTRRQSENVSIYFELCQRHLYGNVNEVDGLPEASQKNDHADRFLLYGNDFIYAEPLHLLKVNKKNIYK